MKKCSLRLRITLMTVVLIGITCLSLKLFLCSSGIHYMNSIEEYLVQYNDGMETYNARPGSRTESENTIESFIRRTQEDFCTSNWYITAAVMLLCGILAYFVSSRALRPLHSFMAHVEKVQSDNLANMKIDEDVLPEFHHLSVSFNQMLERLNRAFETQRQFAGNVAHELRTPLALMQAQLELFSAEHSDVLPETAEFLQLLREQTERLTQLSETLLEMNSLHSVSRTDHIHLGPMIEEIFTDLAPMADRRGILLNRTGDASMYGSDTLVYRLLFNLTENAIKYNRPEGSVLVSISAQEQYLQIQVTDTGYGIPKEYSQSIFQPFFRVDQSRSREYGGVGLGLSLVWEIASLHGGSVKVTDSSNAGTTITVQFPGCNSAFKQDPAELTLY